jgi:hypothetical protein
VLWRTARRDEAGEAFRAALRLAGEGPHPLDRMLRAHLYTRLGRLELTDLRFSAGGAALDSAAALLALDAVQAGDPDRTDDATADQWLELMIDGRAELHAMRFEPDRALAVLEEASPVLESRGTPARKTAFYRLRTTQKMLRNRLRVDEEDIASLRVSVVEAEQSGEEKDVGYASDFLGWALWLRGDLSAATTELTRALKVADRIGETHLRDLALLSLSTNALRRHDAAAMRRLLPKAFAAAEPGANGDRRVAGRLGCSAWLAWQDGRNDEVIRLAGEIERFNPSTRGSGLMYRWVYLFPLLAVRLQAGQTEAAVGAARQITDPSQMWLPDDLTDALDSAGESWDQGDASLTVERLNEALALARAHHYF